MFWMMVIAGTLAGAVVGYLLTRRMVGRSAEACKTDDPGAGCPLCSAAGINVISGGLIGAILVLLGGIASGAVACPLTVCVPSAPGNTALAPATPAATDSDTARPAAPEKAPPANFSAASAAQPSPASGKSVSEKQAAIRPAKSPDVETTRAAAAPAAGNSGQAGSGSVLDGSGIPLENPFAAPEGKLAASRSDAAQPADVAAGATHYAKALTTANFRKATGSGIVVVDFWAEWCGPCHMQAPVIEAFAKKYEGQIQFFKVDIDAEEMLGAQFGNEGIPALAFFRDGKLLTLRRGYHDEEALGELIRQVKDDPLPLLYPYVIRQE